MYQSFWWFKDGLEGIILRTQVIVYVYIREIKRERERVVGGGNQVVSKQI